MGILVDLNVVFALLNERHAFHERACLWVDSLENGDRLVMCRPVQMGLLRLLCNEAAMAGDPVSLPEAWRLYAGLVADPAVIFAHEPEGLTPYWIRYCEPYGASPKILMDAYLAAFSVAAGLRLASFDMDMARFDGVAFCLGRVVLHREGRRIVMTEEGADLRELASGFAKDGMIAFERPEQPQTPDARNL